ncbi:agmatine deiminase family protein [Larsenimonas rhizosphaerae]|uniref:Agmatine deiminase family protein n=1 Tax=Larsenimonas rhizosphaerae TaxID=2944682 RepID=A0AA42CTJ4_9GAMM|nr:agmatine deiminase family protein [Larsenimonas rhizosphaerae]MCX2523687.1 agmatine deiminase family protein [Larsenimonas rhizosphaerae]
MTYSLPAEWYPQDAIQLTWPASTSDWGPLCDRLEAMLEALVLSVTRYQQVLITVENDATGQALASRFESIGVPSYQYHLVTASADDTWTRDHGPITRLNDGHPELLDYRFTGWGGKFEAQQDNALSLALQEQGVWQAPLINQQAHILEGGAIESNGAGTLLTTTACLLNANRTPGATREQWEAHARDQWGITQVLWLTQGDLEGDDTDSHIDTLARFCNETTIAYVRCDNPQDSHYPAFQAMEQELMALRQPNGDPWQLVALPWPRAVHDQEDGHRLPATYANFLITNEEVLVPVYADPADLEALNTLASVFPERRIIPLDCRTVIRQHGSLHCLTMQLPRGTLAPAEANAKTQELS